MNDWCLYFDKKAVEVADCSLKGKSKDCKLMLPDRSKEDCPWLTDKERVITFG
jgi:hypothetical protein